MNIGGDVSFAADGLCFEISQGELKTTSGVEYTNITEQTDIMQGFVMNTDKRVSDVQEYIDSWNGFPWLCF